MKRVGWAVLFLFMVLGTEKAGAQSYFTTPTATPSPTPTINGYYNNPDTAVATALGCPVSVVDEVRELNFDPMTAYLIMRLIALGATLDQILEDRLTMSWEEICAKYGLDWTNFINDLQNRIQNLQPEMITPNQLLRGAANDPTQFPVTLPGPAPNSLTISAPTTEVCPQCK